MIDVYTWTTGNSRKIPIFLEETSLPYRLHMVDIHNGEQFKPEFVAVCPNSKVPAIVDQDGPGGEPLALFESGAILIYLAAKTGRFMPEDLAARYDVLQWVMFQMGGLGPMLGQAHHFRIYAPEKIDYAVNRYTNEAHRLYNVMEAQLEKNEYLACNEYTIADIAAFPWTRSWQNQGIDLDSLPNVKRWHEAIAARPAVKRGVEVLASARKPLMDDKAKEMLFGATQYAKHTTA